MIITVEDIIKSFPEVLVKGKAENQFRNFAKYDCADSNSIIWIRDDLKNYQDVLRATPSKVIVCSHNIELSSFNLSDKTFLITDNPKLFFIKIIKLFGSKTAFVGIHSSVVQLGTNKIHSSANIGPNTVIIDSEIGPNVTIHPNCTIAHAIIKNDVIICSGTRIGSDGFGFGKEEDGRFTRFPHVGKVVIDQYVEIGSNTCIDRGTLGNTIIGEGTKIDNLVHIAHNVEIGKNCLVIALSLIGGSTKLGDAAWVSPSAVIRDDITIGKGAMVGMGAVVIKNIPDNEIWLGNPARFYKQNA